MLAKVKRHWGTCPRKQPVSLDLRIAQRLGVSVQTVRGWRHGHEPARPQSRVAGMVEVCLELGLTQEVERLLHPIEIAKQQITIPEFSVVLQASTQESDANEDVLEARFTADPKRETYLPWRRATLNAIAQQQQLIAAGDARFL